LFVIFVPFEPKSEYVDKRT